MAVVPPYEKVHMSEALLQRRLRTWKSNPIYVAQNFFVFRWESDFLLKTRSGFWHEVECKISFADFKNDFKKFEKHDFLKSGVYWSWRACKSVRNEEALEPFKEYPDMYRIVKTKGRWFIYVRTQRRDNEPRPNYFSYCVPWYMEEMVKPLLPEYAGLVVLEQDGCLKDVKKAPLLHDTKYTDEQFKLAEKYYFHWLHLQQDVERNSQEEKIKELRNWVSFLKAEYKAATGYDIKEVF